LLHSAYNNQPRLEFALEDNICLSTAYGDIIKVIFTEGNHQNPQPCWKIPIIMMWLISLRWRP